MKYEILYGCFGENGKGAVVELNGEQAARLLACGMVKLVGQAPVAGHPPKAPDSGKKSNLKDLDE